MKQRLPYQLLLGLLLVSALSLPALGSSATGPVLQTPESSPTVFSRPLLTLTAYSTDSDGVTPGKEFELAFRIANEGGSKARNIAFSFSPGDFLPSGSGGVVAGGVIAPGANTRYTQDLIASGELLLKAFGSLQISASYTDDFGTSYSETFNLTLPVKRSSSGTSRPTSTPTPAPRPILIIGAYSVDLDLLKPGSVFNLTIQVTNVGGSEARDVTLVLGGGTVSTGASGTPGADGGSGVSGSASLENFAPLGESNVAYLGNLDPAALLASVHALIVNSTTQPGAYPLKLSLIYSDTGGRLFTDDHSITLLVYSPPLLEIGFYQTPDPFFAGQPGNLPVQVLNLDRKPVVLSRVRVEAAGAEMSNNELPIGYLDTGLTFTIDAQAVPLQSGPLEVVVSVDYVDDFNKPQVIEQALQVEVLESEPIPVFPDGGGLTPDFAPVPPETFWDKVLRLLRGLVGLDSSAPESAPVEGLPTQGPIQIVPGAPGTKG